LRRDQHDLPLHAANGTAVSRLDQAVDSLLHFRADVGERVEDALAEDPGLPVANALRVYLGVLSTDPLRAARAGERFHPYHRSVRHNELTPRERGHLDAASRLLDGDLKGAAALLTAVSQADPRDAVALAVGHQLDYLTGDATLLRDRVGGALMSWSTADPHYANLLGMYAFGLEECGHWDLAEETGLHALDLDRGDVWGIHAVAHSYEMRGRFVDGVRLLDERRCDWDVGTLLQVHVWWHYCLYLLEAGQVEQALRIYDAQLRPGESSNVNVLEVLNAAALLWRLYLEGVRPTSRWRELAELWPPLMGTAFHAFNDMHAVMSYVGAGDHAAAARLIEARLRFVADAPGHVTNAAMTARVGLPVCQALLAFGRDRWADAVDLLWPVRHRVHEFGGSHAQRDVVHRTLIEAALRAGRADQARRLISERTAIRPDSPYNRLKRQQLDPVRFAGGR
jgi:tetratricopeptide (TPR) repeat protein